MSFANVLNQFKKSRRRTRSSAGSSSIDTENNSQLTSSLDVVGRNSMALPIIMRDINVMKQGILKLVKIAGGTQRDKADRFFLASSDREKAYESQMAAKTSKSPTKVGGDKKDGKGFFGQANDFLNSIIAGGLTNMLIKGGLIAGILYSIGKFFTSAEFRNGIFDMIGKFGRTVFGEEGWKDVKKNILYGSAILLAGMVAIKGTISLVVAGLAYLAKKLFGFGGVPMGPGGPTNKNKSPVGSVFRGLGMAGVGLGLYNLFSGGGNGEESSGLGGVASAATGLAASLAIDKFSGSRTTTPATTTPATTENDKGPRPKGKYSGRAWDMNNGVSKTSPIKATTPKFTFLTFLEKRAPELFKKIGQRLLAAGAGLFVPGPGWFMTALSIVGTASLAWELYRWWQKYNGEDGKQSTSPTKEEPETEKQSKNMSLEEMISGAGIDLKINNTPNYYAMPGASAPRSTSSSTSPSPSTSAPSTSSPSPSTSSGNFRITGKFGEQRAGGHIHKGIDIAAPAGTPVLAVADGEITAKGFDTHGYGNWVEVSHKDGSKTRYAHLREKSPAMGKVQLGQQIGSVGSTGRSTGNHLHFELLKNGQKVAADDKLAMMALSQSSPQLSVNKDNGNVSGKALSEKTGALNTTKQQIQQPPVNIDARTSNSTNGGGGGQINLPASGVADTELIKLLVERAIG